MDFKTLVDSLASLASIVAILTVLVGWYRNTRKPLRIVRVVVHKHKDRTTFILVTRNRQPYPVITKRIDCFKGKIYEVQKKVGGKVEFSERLSSRVALFMSSHEFEVPASANTDLRIEINDTVDVPERLLFSVDTSHGYHELWCDVVSIVEVGKTEVYAVDYQKEYSSKLVAKLMYYWKIIGELTKRSSRCDKARG